ncbi:hypothetical protein NDU88_000585 [Pleurodeles waltl]|uniref:Uncharacterized protein n=1 Tax=Pleurodeles waltl TaxID=8319 RepID=A0AAV7MMH4_PLEWA|nr:hypothetical protein NDU88_000585 [Pleurodeles waltl]
MSAEQLGAPGDTHKKCLVEFRQEAVCGPFHVVTTCAQTSVRKTCVARVKISARTEARVRAALQRSHLSKNQRADADLYRQCCLQTQREAAPRSPMARNQKTWSLILVLRGHRLSTGIYTGNTAEADVAPPLWWT